MASTSTQSQQLEAGLKDYLISLAMLGDQSVGKTSLVLRHTEGSFNPRELTTIGLDYKEFPFEFPLDDKTENYTIRLYDTAGQERYRAITASFLKRVEAIAIVFDLTNRDSFMNVRSWLKFIKDSPTSIVFPLDQAPPKDTMGKIIIIGNKSDLATPSSLEDIRRDAENDPVLSLFPLFFASALDGVGVTEPFSHLCTMAIQRRHALLTPPVIENRQSISLPTHDELNNDKKQTSEPSHCCR